MKVLSNNSEEFYITEVAQSKSSYVNKNENVLSVSAKLFSANRRTEPLSARNLFPRYTFHHQHAGKLASAVVHLLHSQVPDIGLDFTSDECPGGPAEKAEIKLTSANQTFVRGYTMKRVRITNKQAYFLHSILVTGRVKLNLTWNCIRPTATSYLKKNYTFEVYVG